MRVPIVVPDLGSIDEPFRVSGWFVDEGDVVRSGDLVVELLIPGITFDVMAESTGRLVEITKRFDTTIHSGDILGWLDDANIVDGDV